MGSTTSTQHELDFNELSGDDFERLILYLIDKDPEFIDYEHYGGVGDKGRDIIAIKQVGVSKETWYFQCKRYEKKIKKHELEKELKKIHNHCIEDPDFKPDAFVFVISCTVPATMKDEIKKQAKEMGLSKLHFWTRPKLNVMVNKNPVALGIFYGIGYSVLFDKFQEQVKRELRRVESKFISGLYTQRERAEELLSLIIEPLGTLFANSILQRGFWLAPDKPQNDGHMKFSSLLKKCLEIIETERRSRIISINERIVKLILEEIKKERTFFESQKEHHWIDQINILESYMRNILSWIQTQIFLIVDPAGTGKTNLLCNWALESLGQDSSYDVLLLTGNLSIRNESGIAKYLLRSLKHIGANIDTLSNLLLALQHCIKEEGKPVVIVIDAINENRDIESTNASLEQFLDDVSNYPEIKVIISCRTDYLKRFSFHHERANLKLIRGLLHRFNSDEVRRAIPLHLKHFRINADFSDAALDALSMPFVLRMFCEAHGNTENRRVIQKGYFQDILLHKLFLKYEKRKFKDLHKKFPTEFREQRPFQKCLLKIAKLMLDNNDNRIRIEDLPEECESIDAKDSLYIRLLDEEIFFEETPSDTETYVQFTSDTYREYRQARYLHSLYEKSVSEFTLFINNLISNSSRIMSEGLLRFLFVELRLKSKINLWEIITSSDAITGSIEGLAQLEADEIQDKDEIFIKSMIETEYARIFNLTFRKPSSPDWKLGLSLQDQLLSDMTSVNRDLMFGSFICESRDYVNNQIICKLRDIGSTIDKEIDLRKAKPLVKSAIWLLGSNVEGLRYAANLALLELGIHKPEWMLDLIRKHWTVNDYYIRERLLSLVYALSIINPKIAVSCAEKVNELFLDDSSEHYSTHFMVREFARDIVLTACESDLHLFSKSQIDRIKRINRPIDTAKHEPSKIRPDETQTGFSNYPIMMDMKIYEFGHMAHDFNRHRCDATDIAIEIIRKRGYSEDHFGDIDREISNKYWNYPNDDEVPTKIERFGKKYAWQAYRILQGEWIDTLPFVSEYEEDYLRFTQREFDPLFPKTDQIQFNLGIDMLGDLPLDQWLKQPPPPIERIVLRKDDWVVVGGNIIQSIGENRRVALGIESFLIDSSVAQSRINEIQCTNYSNMHNTIHHFCYNHEIPLRWELDFDGLLWTCTSDEVNELFVMSGRSEYRLGKGFARYALRADFVQKMGLKQKPRTMNFTTDGVSDAVKTQSWIFSQSEPLYHPERGEWILVRSDFLKDYLQRKNKQLIIKLIVDRWGKENKRIRKISYDTYHIR